MSNFGEILKDLREKRGMSQPDLADKLGVTRVSISNYENGKASPSYEGLLKIADIFNVTTDYLLGRKEADKHYIDKSNALPEEKAKIERFLKSTEVLIRGKGSKISEEELGYLLRFMEFHLKDESSK
ncbi:helix-turn-helix domain-containing protein [Paenibacillus elgii]|uniref:helix-turn-helix domain-containing protein n=1 Tax=Paenibacillus elgii TaxID=189691 RepID=UPI00203A60A3|nr:helix-turn-helix transcriptional regulator [Paenibacillus elgii]